MSDDFDTEDEENESESSVIRDLRAKARGRAEAEERATTAERKLAFIEAGVPTTPATAYFVKGYDGELTSEAIKEAAVAAGFIAAEEEQSDPELDEEAAAHARLADAEGGSKDTAPPGYDDELAAAKTPEEVIAVIQKFGGKVINT
jgi:hypothetical protein